MVKLSLIISHFVVSWIGLWLIIRGKNESYNELLVKQFTEVDGLLNSGKLSTGYKKLNKESKEKLIAEWEKTEQEQIDIELGRLEEIEYWKEVKENLWTTKQPKN